MARAIRRVVTIALVVLASSAEARGRRAPAPVFAACNDKLARTAQKDPLYLAMTRAYGPATSCERAGSDGKTTLTWAFPGDARFVVKVTEEIGYEMHSAALTMPVAKGIELLQRSERARFPPNGCGIKWDAPAGKDKDEKGSYVSYQAADVNCKGLVYGDGEKTTLLTLSYAD